MKHDVASGLPIVIIFSLSFISIGVFMIGIYKVVPFENTKFDALAYYQSPFACSTCLTLHLMHIFLSLQGDLNLHPPTDVGTFFKNPFRNILFVCD